MIGVTAIATVMGIFLHLIHGNVKLIVQNLELLAFVKSGKFQTDSYNRNKISVTLCITEEEDILSAFTYENNRQFKECNVIGTPTFFINGYMLPGQYDIDDVNYFREALKEQEEFTNEKVTVK